MAIEYKFTAEEKTDEQKIGELKEYLRENDIEVRL